MRKHDHAPTDQEVLDALLRETSQLDSDEIHIIRSMSGMLERSGMLSPKQRGWADRVYNRLELEAKRTLNLVSSGQVPRGNVPTFSWELNRPLKPPGR